MTTLLGFMILQEDGTPVFSYLRDSEQDNSQSLLPNLLVVIQMFAKDLLTGSEKGRIKSITLTDTVFTISDFDLQTPSRKENRYYFVLLSDDAKKSEELDTVLEYLIVNFLFYNKGEFMVKLRINATDLDEFEEYKKFLEPLMNTKLGNIMKKRVTPPAFSFIQGMLNEMAEHLSADQMVSWNDKLVSLGKSYVWLSDDLTKKEEAYILDKIKEHLSDAAYEKMAERINSQL